MAGLYYSASILAGRASAPFVVALVEAPYLTDMELRCDYEAIVRLNSSEPQLSHRFFNAPFTAQKTR